MKRGELRWRRRGSQIRGRQLDPDVRHLRRVIAQIGLLQIDSVNVLVRSHYLPLFSRLGGYAPEILDASWRGLPASRELFEYWGHMASLMPLEMHPLLRWRMAEAARDIIATPGDTRSRLSTRARGSCGRRSKRLAERGALSARELTGAGVSAGGWWGWSDGKRALEALFAAGLASRRPDVAASSGCTIFRSGSSRRKCSRCRRPRLMTRSAH